VLISIAALPLNLNPGHLEIVYESEVSLLGGIISKDPDFFLRNALLCVRKWRSNVELLSQFADPQIQLLLLRACMGAPKLNYLLRTVAPGLIVPALAEMKHFLFLTLRDLCVGIKDGFETFQFDLASLRIKDGGLGILNPLDISKYAYVASYIATRTLQGRILCEIPANRVIIHDMDPVDGDFSQALDDLLDFLGETGMHRELPHYTQHHWAALYFEIKRKQVFSSPYISSQPSSIQRRFLAILQSLSAKHASAYLFALPNAGLGQVMTLEEFRANMGLRLLIPLFSGLKNCSRPKCTHPMDPFGYHAINCCTTERFKRHEEVANQLCFLAHDAGLQPVRNASVHCLGPSWRPTNRSKLKGFTDFRPADLLINGVNGGRSCVDCTIVSPIRSSITPPLHFVPGLAALNAQEDKYDKHLIATNAAHLGFHAFASDCFGVLAPHSSSLLRRIALCLVCTKGYPAYLAKQLVFRKISFAIHLGVARQLVARKEFDF